MKALEKAKLALREHLLKNKEQVASDLEFLRKNSKGHDIFSYVEHFSTAFSFEEISISNEITYDFSSQKIDSYEFLNEKKLPYWSSPPEYAENKKTKKDSETSSESFFFDIFVL